MTQDYPQLVLNDARFGMSESSRIITTWISYLGWISASILAARFLIYGATPWNWAGALVALFLLDRVLHLGRADKPLTEVSPRGRANIAEFLTPGSLKIIMEAEAKSSKGNNFTAEVLKQLLHKSLVRKIFSRLGVSVPELREKLSRLPKRELKDAFKEAQNLARLAMIQALKSKSEDVGILEVLAALSESGDRDFLEVLKSFSIKPQLLKWGSALVSSSRPNFSKKPEPEAAPLRPPKNSIPLPSLPAEVK